MEVGVCDERVAVDGDADEGGDCGGEEIAPSVGDDVTAVEGGIGAVIIDDEPGCGLVDVGRGVCKVTPLLVEVQPTMTMSRPAASTHLTTDSKHRCTVGPRPLTP